MNAYRWATDARHRTSEPHIPSKNYCTLFEKTELVDSFAIHHAGEFKPSFEQTRNNEIHYMARLDAALVSQSLIDTVIDCDVIKCNLLAATSDHNPVVLILSSEELGIQEATIPKLNPQYIDRIDVKEANNHQKRKSVQENIKKEFTTDSPLSNALARELTNKEYIEEAEAVLADTIKHHSRVGYGTYEIELNRPGIFKENKKVAKLRRYLCRIRRAIGSLHRIGIATKNSKCWRKLLKNPEKYLPATLQGDKEDFDFAKMKRELRVVQHTLEKELNNLDRIKTSERIDKYLDQLDEHEEKNPQRFFRKANIDKKRGKKMLYEICLRDKDGNITQVIDKADEVKEFIRKYWAKIFEKQEVDNTITKEWFNSPAWKEMKTRVRNRASDLNALINNRKGSKRSIDYIQKRHRTGRRWNTN